MSQSKVSNEIEGYSIGLLSKRRRIEIRSTKDHGMND